MSIRSISRAALLPFLVLVTSTAVRADVIVSDFEGGTEGWQLSGDSSTATPDHIASDGNPGAFIRGFDTAVGGVWYFAAPAKFLGNRSTSYGGTLQYSLRQRGSGSIFNSQDIIIDGAGLTLRLVNTPPIPSSSTWTQYVATLDETDPWTLASGGNPTQAEFQSVMADLQSLRIRGEFIVGSDNGDLDSVSMTAVPEPSHLGVLAFTCVLLRWRRAKR
ncbi:MAG: laminin B domain-containing protein [Planctomycetota bacterium]